MSPKVVEAVRYLDEILIRRVEINIELPAYVVARSIIKSKFDLTEDEVSLAMCCFTWSPLYQFAGKIGTSTLRPVIPND